MIDLETVTQAIDDLGVGTLTPLPASLAAPTITPIAPSVAPPGSPTALVAPAPVALRRRGSAPPVAVPAPLVQRLRLSRSLRPRGARHRANRSTLRRRSARRCTTEHSIFGKKRPRSRLRWRLLRWAASATVVAAIVFVRSSRRSRLHPLLPGARRPGPPVACAGATARPRDACGGSDTLGCHPASPARPTPCASSPARRRPRASEPHLPRGVPRGHTPRLEQALPALRQRRAVHRLEQAAPALPRLWLPLRTRLRRCLVGLDRDRSDSDRHRHRPSVFRISRQKLLDGRALLRVALATAAADDSPAIRARDRHHLSDSETMAGPEG